MACTNGIQLSKEVSVYDVTSQQQAWRMVVTVVAVNNIVPAIFLFNRSTVGDGQEDVFVGVCSPVDLVEQPVVAPAAGGLFRATSVELLARTKDLLDLTWDELLSDVGDLVQTAENICDLGITETEDFGTLSDSSSSSSSSGSSESSAVCPVDAVAAIEIIASDDPEFPVGAVFLETAPGGGPTPCYRMWDVDAVITPNLGLVLVTSLVDNIYTLRQNTDGVLTPIAAGGLAAQYKAIIAYTRGLNSYTVEIEQQ